MGSPKHLTVPEGSRGYANDSTPDVHHVEDRRQPISPCRYCKQLIGWDRSSKGKPIPVNPNGGVHFATCSSRKRLTIPLNQCNHCGGTNTHRGPGSARVPSPASLICDDCGRQRWLPAEAAYR
jgi:hypothetical protein